MGGNLPLYTRITHNERAKQMNKTVHHLNEQQSVGHARPLRNLSAGYFSIPEGINYLKSGELEALTRAFLRWKNAAVKPASRRSRTRIWIIFLLLRHSGARPGEISLIRPEDFDIARRAVLLGRRKDHPEPDREVLLPEEVIDPVCAMLQNTPGSVLGDTPFFVDSGYLRRLFYERGAEAGLARKRSCPTVLRNSRAVEMLRQGIPLTLVQRILGHVSAGQTMHFKSYNQQQLALLLRHYAAMERRKKNSARNCFHGVVTSIRNGPVMSEVELESDDGRRIFAIVTKESLEDLGLEAGLPACASIKAAQVNIAWSGSLPRTSARNCFTGTISSIKTSPVITEFIITLDEETEICSLVDTGSVETMELQPGYAVTVFFKALSVTVQVD